MLEVDIFDKDVLYEVRYGHKDETTWCSRHFYWDESKAMKKYNDVIADWNVELIRYKFDKSFMYKNFAGEFSNLECGQYPNKFFESSLNPENKEINSLDIENGEIGW